jgi:tetratricopeptide (TPR) repeat protein
MARLLADPPAQPDPVATPSPSRGTGLLRYVVPLLCLVQFGLIGGWAFTRYLEHAASTARTDVSGDQSAPEVSGRAASGEGLTVEHADDLMREGRCDLALKIYEPLAGAATGGLRDALQYRVGLCEEGLGRTDLALKAYRIVRRTENPRAAAAAEIGQARVMIRLRRPGEAKNLLYPLLLRAGTSELRTQPYLADARYLLALTLTLDALHGEKPGPLSDALADYTATDWPVETALDWVGTVAEEKSDRAKPSGETVKETKADATAEPEKDGNFLMLLESGTGPQSLHMSAAVSQGTLQELLERLAERARLKVEWSEAARKLAAERGAALTVDDLPVTDMLIDVVLPLTDQVGLLATIQEGTLRLVAEAETPSDALTAYRTVLAKRALNNAVTSNPGHRLTAAACLELGQLEARAGQWKLAAERYDRLCHDFRRSPLMVEASYNLGLVRLKLGETAEARAAFYAARDHAPGHELAPLALLQVGRAFLLDGAPEQALKPLRDALAVASGSPTEPAAALTLAGACLLIDQPALASRVLREHREPISQPPYRATGIFLDAYAQFLAVKGKSKAPTHEASDLLAALWGVAKKEPVLGVIGPLLLGHAYRDLDHPDDMIAVYQQARNEVRGPAAAEMTFAVAEDLYQRNKREAARALYAPLVKGDDPRWAAAAQLRLAEIALLEDRPKDTLQACRRLLEDKQSVKRDTVLLLMSRAYEMTREYRKAAQCLEGQVPE